MFHKKDQNTDKKDCGDKNPLHRKFEVEDVVVVKNFDKNVEFTFDRKNFDMNIVSEVDQRKKNTESKAEKTEYRQECRTYQAPRKTPQEDARLNTTPKKKAQEENVRSLDKMNIKDRMKEIRKKFEDKKHRPILERDKPHGGSELEDRKDKKRKDRGDIGTQDSPSRRKKPEPDSDKNVDRTGATRARILRTRASPIQDLSLNLKTRSNACELFKGEDKNRGVPGEGHHQDAGHADRQATLGEGALGNGKAVWKEAACIGIFNGATHGEYARTTPL